MKRSESEISKTGWRSQLSRIRNLFVRPPIIAIPAATPDRNSNPTVSEVEPVAPPDLKEPSPIGNEALHQLTQAPFRPQASLEKPVPIGGITPNERCNLSCVMCHFNGPKAEKKTGALEPEKVLNFLRQVPGGSSIWFASFGEFYLDPNALTYLWEATRLGLKPCVLSHGNLYDQKLLDATLEAGVRFFRMSVDSTDPAQYVKIRRGGDFTRILGACAYLRLMKKSYPEIRVEINATLFRNTYPKQEEMIEFWRGKVDQVNFNAEYFDIFRYRNLNFLPERRNDCKLQLYLLPSGRLAPCCALQVYSHEHDVSWLPHIDEGPLETAYAKLTDLYKTPGSPLSTLCANCDWWIMWTENQGGRTPYLRCVPLD